MKVLPISRSPQTLAPLDKHLEPALRARIDGKAKPLGALGRIEDLAVQIGLITHKLAPKLQAAAVVIAAADHGIVEEGVTAYPSEVSALIAQMALAGGAGVNMAATSNGADVFVIDAGLKTRLAPNSRLFDRRIGAGTANFLHGPAMTGAQMQAALDAGVELAAHLHQKGYGVLALGEIGIGNTSSAALLAHAITGIELKLLVGPGAGAPSRGLAHKIAVLTQAYGRNPVHDAAEALIEFGGFEIAILAGLMIGAARTGVIAIVDGFIATAAALAAIAMEPNLRDYLIFGHLSPEPGHGLVLQWLGVKPLFDLGLRLGEGTGAALAIPLVKMAALLLTEMADLPPV